MYVYRNGVVADALRTVMPYRLIYGLQIPQLSEIARSLPLDIDLALYLWRKRHIREARILATYLFPPREVSLELGLDLARDTLTREESDMLAFRLFKRMPEASALLSLMEEDPHVDEYTVAALRNHLS